MRPLHKAPWVDSGEALPDTAPLVEQQLAGDFFCAPFGVHPGLPIHGWTANGFWRPDGVQGGPDGAKTVR